MLPNHRGENPRLYFMLVILNSVSIFSAWFVLTDGDVDWLAVVNVVALVAVILAARGAATQVIGAVRRQYFNGHDSGGHRD